MLRVLSVDWDYFINASAQERAEHFPDVPDEGYSKSLQDVIWTSRYSEDNYLLSIGVDPLVERLAADIKYIPYVVIADSHRWMYQFTVRMLQEKKEEELHIFNIDFHSDCRDDLDKLDCGNWYSHLMSKYHGFFFWLGRKDSYIVKKPRKLRFQTDYNQAGIASVQWDMLFVCRSDMWSPPHLDNEFIRIFKPLIKGKDGSVQHGIWESRYTDKMQKDAEVLRKDLVVFRKSIRQKNI